jgi:aerobic carbon-monoxide dehydrogenase small subunit
LNGAKVRMSFSLNGKKISDDVEPNQTLCDYLHDVAGTTGVKKGCDTGECGACTIILDGKPVVSCLMLAPQVNNRSVVTVEGLGTESNPHPIQRAFVELDAVQCGYCIPGMIVNMSWILDHAPEVSDTELKRLLSGNLCRCTGYVQQMEAFKLARSRRSGSGARNSGTTSTKRRYGSSARIRR